jgi:TonB family protein
MSAINLRRAFCFTLLGILPGVARADHPSTGYGDLAYSGDFEKRPEVKYMPEAFFPPFLVQQHLKGQALIAFRINSEGYVDEVRVVSATHPAYGGCAMACVSRMVFRPATKHGQNVDAIGKMAILFEFK